MRAPTVSRPAKKVARPTSVPKKAPAKKTTTVAKKAPAPTAKKTAAKKSAPAKKAAAATSGTSAPKKTAAKKAAKKATKKSTPNKESTVTKQLEVGSSVLVQVDPRQNGGSDVASGTVVKAGEESVNVRVLLDSEETLYLRDVSVTKQAPKDEDKTQSEDETASEAKVRQRVCWPVK